MAFRSDSPIMVALPPFRGVTRRLILLAVGAFFALAIISLFSREMGALLAGFLSFEPNLAYKLPWQLVTYPFIETSILGLLFAALSVWFFGSPLEDELGSRWLAQFFFACTIGGALVAMLLCFSLTRRVPGLTPYDLTGTLWPFSIALLLAFARLHADQELNFYFVLQVKAKYIAAIYLLVYLAIALSSNQRLSALVVLTNSLCGWLYVVYAPRRGFRFTADTGLANLRSSWLRAKRRRAAKKFSVYMQKQGREVHFDASGRYVDPDGKPRDPRDPQSPRDPNDRSWMN